MSMDWSASLKQKMMAAFWFSGFPSPSFTPSLLSGLLGSRTLPQMGGHRPALRTVHRLHGLHRAWLVLWTGQVRALGIGE